MKEPEDQEARREEEPEDQIDQPEPAEIGGPDCI